MLSLFLPWIPFKEISSVHTTTVVYNRDKSRKDPVSHLAVRMSDRQDSWRVIVEMGCEIFKQRVKRTLLALRNIDLCFNKSVLSSFPVAQMVKCLPAMQETQVRFLGQEDPLEKEMATDFSILAWKTPWTVAYMDCRLRSLIGDSPWSCKDLDTTERLSDFTLSLTFVYVYWLFCLFHSFLETSLKKSKLI